MNAQQEFPLRFYKPGVEWLVELAWPEDAEGHIAVCGLFHSTDEATARSFYELAKRIVSCWYVDQIWKGEGKPHGTLQVAPNIEPQSESH